MLRSNSTDTGNFVKLRLTNIRINKAKPDIPVEKGIVIL
jgi:hypothetical protein